MFGNLDEVGSSIRGWIWDGTPARLRVLCRIDSVWEASAEAGEFRPDVRDAGYGDGYSGFTLQVPGQLFDGQEHRLEVLVPEKAGWAFPGYPDVVVLGMPEVRLHRLTRNDAPAHAEFWLRHMQGFGKAPTPQARTQYQQNLLTLLAQSNSAAFAISANGGIVGACTLEGRAHAGYRHVAVLRIVLLSPYCGKKLGGSLLAASLDHARNLGLRRVELTVNVNNLRARRLYQRFGFREEGVLQDTFFDGQKYHDEIMMALILEPDPGITGKQLPCIKPA